MTTVLTEVELTKAVAERGFIAGGAEKSIEGLKYDFTIDSLMLFAGGGPLETSGMLPDARSLLAVRPGELVYVRSAERLNLPPDIKAELSPKRGVSQLGILILGGFCVDPGYQGRLIFGLYNLSGRPFTLTAGDKIIAAQFYSLDEDEKPHFTPTQPIDSFPPELVQLMQSYEPATLMGVHQRLDQLGATVGELRHQLESREDWFKEFRQFLKELGGRVDQVAQTAKTLEGGLAAETEARKTIGTEVGSLKVAAAVGSARYNIAVGLAVAILVALVILVVRA